jgi:hypothetical protein
MASSWLLLGQQLKIAWLAGEKCLASSWRVACQKLASC